MSQCLTANWVGGGRDNGRYVVVGKPWVSLEGQLWIDSRTGEALDNDDFYSSTITMVGGLCDGEVVG